MFYVYVLQSIDFPDKFYTGYTADLRERLAQHDRGHIGHIKNILPGR